MRTRFDRLVAALLCLMVLAPGMARSAEPLHIRLGWIVLPATWGPILFSKELAKKGILHHYGTSYVVDPIHFQGSSLALTALAANQVDITTLAFSSYALAICNAGLDDLRIVADEFQDGVDGYATNEFTVLRSGPITSIQDLKGKTAAVNAKGTAVDIALRVYLQRHGLDPARDVNIIEAPLPGMNAMLLEHKVDLVASVLPFNINPAFRKATRVLFTERDAMGQTQFSFWTARSGFLAKNHAAVVDFMEDAIRAAHWFLDPRNHQEAVEIVAKATKRPAEAFAWAFTKKDYYRNPNLIPDLSALQANINLQHGLGFLRCPVDVAAHADLGLVREAGRRLH